VETDKGTIYHRQDWNQPRSANYIRSNLFNIETEALKKMNANIVSKEKAKVITNVLLDTDEEIVTAYTDYLQTTEARKTVDYINMIADVEETSE
jgi:hypothetical protein